MFVQQTISNKKPHWRNHNTCNDLSANSIRVPYNFRQSTGVACVEALILPNNDLMTASVVNVKHSPRPTLMTPRLISIFEEAKLLKMIERVRFLPTACNSLTTNKWNVTPCSWSLQIVMCCSLTLTHVCLKYKDRYNFERMSHTLLHQSKFQWFC